MLFWLHGSRGACLSSTLLGVEVIVGVGFFLHSSPLVHSEDSKDSDSLLYRPWPSLQVPSGIV